MELKQLLAWQSEKTWVPQNQLMHHEQIQKLSKYATLVHSPIPTIEDLGGGSVR
jgi:hypothetical protein